MSGITISGIHNSAITLAASPRDVAVTGTINGYGAAGTLTVSINGTVQTPALSAALIGPAGTDFTIDNTGLILSVGTNASNWFDAGIALNAPGSITNSGTIEGAAGAFIQGNSVGTQAWVSNSTSGLIEGSISAGLFLSAPGSVLNAGIIEGVQVGVIGQSTSAVTVYNASTGLISTSGNNAVELQDGLVINAGVLEGLSGVQLDGSGTLENSGIIHGTVSVVGTNGVQGAVNGGIGTSGTGIFVTNAVGGHIIGAAGVQIYNPGTGFLTLTTQANVVSNAGTILGTLGGAVVDWVNSASILNTGLIDSTIQGLGTNGSNAGVVVGSGGGVLNSGTIMGADGVRFDFGGALLNAGVIVGGVPAGSLSGYAGVFGQGSVTVGNTITGTISGATGVDLQGLGGNVASNGLIVGSTNNGVYLQQAGTVLNGGTILGAHHGVVEQDVSGGVGGFIGNSGLIEATSQTFGTVGAVKFSAGIVLGNGGFVTNTSAGTISGGSGANLGGAVTLLNAGTIEGTAQAGVVLQGFGSVVNTGVISGASLGAYVANGGAVINAGTISGGTDALLFTGTGLDHLTIEHGSVIEGAVTTTGSASIFLTLDTVTSASTFDLGGTVSGVSQFLFNSTDWTLKGTAAELGGHNINGFVQGDTLVVEGFAATSETFTPIAGTSFENLELVSATTTITLNFMDVFGTNPLAVAAVANGTQITLTELPCFVRGTRILTARGEVCVEDLAVGDVLPTALAGAQAIKWIGTRKVDVTQHNNPQAVWPVLISAGAFGEGLPQRDLYVSPGHSVYVDGVLIQAEKLINGATIRQIPCAQVEYWHVELPSHDILLSENLPTESYLDTGNRTAFANGGAFLELHPDFRPKHWAETCVPLVQEGAVLTQTKGTLLGRAADLGYEIVAEDDLHVLADGKRIEALGLGDQCRAFVIPEGCTDIQLRSRMFVPARYRADCDDQRVLGACVSRLQIDGTDVALDDDAQFGAGWYGCEQEPSRTQRWTTGSTPLPGGCRLVVVDLAGQGHYWQQPEQAAGAVALTGTGQRWGR